MVCGGGNPIRSRNHGNSQTYGTWIQDKPCQHTLILWNSVELHHDPFLSFTLGGYNYEWYGTVHAHHYPFPYAWKISSVDTAYTILSPTRRRWYHYMRHMFTFASMFTTHHSWLYSGGASIPDKCYPETSRQQWKRWLPIHAEDTERQPSGLIHGGNPSIAFTCSTAIIQRRIEQDEHDPGQFCSFTYVDNTHNNRKSQAKPCQHSTGYHWPHEEPETAAGLYDIWQTWRAHPNMTTGTR